MEQLEQLMFSAHAAEGQISFTCKAFITNKKKRAWNQQKKIQKKRTKESIEIIPDKISRPCCKDLLTHPEKI
jgi:hypothetical protein